MKNTKKSKKLITLASIAALSMAALFCPATTISAQAATAETTISPCADVIEWRYKIEDGKLYRRLYNSTTASWVGEWEYVRDV